MQYCKEQDSIAMVNSKEGKLLSYNSFAVTFKTLNIIHTNPKEVTL